MIKRLRSGRTVGTMSMREEIQRELAKERIREEILSDELERLRFLEADLRNLIIDLEMPAMPRIGGFPSSLLLEQPLHCQFEQPENRTIAMPFQDRFDGSRRQCRDIRGSPVRNYISLGKSSGSKRKAPAAETAKEGFSCRVCRITASSERCLNLHFSGKKHLAKMADINPGSKKIKKGHKTERKEDAKEGFFAAKNAGGGTKTPGITSPRKRRRGGKKLNVSQNAEGGDVSSDHLG